MMDVGLRRTANPTYLYSYSASVASPPFMGGAGGGWPLPSCSTLFRPHLPHSLMLFPVSEMNTSSRVGSFRQILLISAPTRLSMSGLMEPSLSSVI